MIKINDIHTAINPSNAIRLSSLNIANKSYIFPEGRNAMMYVEAMINDGIASGSGIKICKMDFIAMFVLAISHANEVPSNNENPVTVIPKITVLINGLKISAELIKFIKFACSANSRKII